MLRLVSTVLAVAVLAALIAGCPAPKPALTPGAGKAIVPPVGASQAGAISGELTVFIPCGMIIPVQAVIDRFAELNPTVEVVPEFDNANILVDKMVDKGAKADVYISPGETEIGRLAEAGLIDLAAAKTVGTFELVVIVNRNSTLAIASPEDLKKCKTISIPDPAENSVGASGKTALEKLGLWDELQPKLLKTKRAIESHTMVAGAKSDAGIAYRNCPLETNPEKLSTTKVAIAFAFPEDSYQLQRCLVGALKDAPNPAAAAAFVEFMASQEGRKILADNGMTGCLDIETADASAGAKTDASKAEVKVVAFYPGNEDHKPIRDLVEGLSKEYGGRVSGEFVDFTSDEGFKKWRGAGLSCGAILINDQQTWSYKQAGADKEVTFMMAEGGEWTKDDLHGVIKMLLGKGKKSE